MLDIKKQFGDYDRSNSYSRPSDGSYPEHTDNESSRKGREENIGS